VEPPIRRVLAPVLVALNRVVVGRPQQLDDPMRRVALRLFLPLQAQLLAQEHGLAVGVPQRVLALQPHDLRAPNWMMVPRKMVAPVSMTLEMVQGQPLVEPV
jgi:hypothetical protein